VNTGLLLIDIQNDYFPGGKMELEGSEAAARQASELLRFFRQRSMPIFHIQHISRRPGATFFLPDTFGVQIHDSVKPWEGETLIRKHFPNSFRETNLLACLQSGNISRLVVAGMMTHMCVHAAVRAAADLGFNCRLVADACATRL
jgi:nicotinamidase-related amidase